MPATYDSDVVVWAEERMAILLAHWLKWQFQPERRSASWERTLREQRKRVFRKLREVPSLRPLLTDPEWTEDVWGDAVTEAIRDTNPDVYPETCPWPLTDVLMPEWQPP